MRTYENLYLDGAWVAPTVAAPPTPVHSAADGSVVATVPAGSPADIDAAVSAARRAFESWSQTTPAERAALLTAIADALEARADELAEITAVEVGMPRKLARRVQIGGPLTVLRSYADLLGTYEFTKEVNNSLVVKEPAGVVGAITPWNYPLNQVIAKVGPALAAGCTIVLKPSDEAPSPVFAFAEACQTAGLPAGVFNLVSGGDEVGKALASHADVDVVSFTGSTAAGSSVAQAAGRHINRVALELGGKSANVILDDADLEKAVTAGVNNAMLNSGQTCAAWTRMLVPASRHDEAVEIAQRALAKLTLGHPLEETTRLGPLASAEQQTRVRSYIEVGVAEGARLVAGGPEVPADVPEGGYYVQPTIFADVKPSMRIAREEIFGPVLSIMPYSDEEEAVAIANDTDYGLHGAVWSADSERALRVARRLRTGQVDVNGGAWNPLAPFGGYKKSGLGREYGEAGLDEYLEIKSIQR
ncbi:aldehyde dehydrogenase family protein [Sporichthya polymorpha]|uniref:aldehyde dehydrogenase family protein n=1 Tax=Sporichthya polymorpha TaxID=35751 RepID=UPI00036FD8F2|nr:aldehyde dehydrogenase family protein [Sporichthya polymorpha]